MYTYIYLIYKTVMGKRWCIYFWTFLNTIKLFSSVILTEPNIKFSIEITVYGVILVNNCILAFV